MEKYKPNNKWLFILVFLGDTLQTSLLEVIAAEYPPSNCTYVADSLSAPNCTNATASAPNCINATDSLSANGTYVALCPPARGAAVATVVTYALINPRRVGGHGL